MEELTLAIGDIIVGIDIGSSKVSLVMGEVNNFNQIEVICSTSEKCKGIKKSIIIDEDEIALAISKVIQNAEEEANLKINSAYVTIPGKYVTIVQNSITKDVKDKYSKLFEEYSNIKLEIAQNYGDDKEKQRKLDLLNYQVNEIENANLKVGEEKELEERRTVIMSSEKITLNLSDAENKLNDIAIDSINIAIKDLEKIASKKMPFHIVKKAVPYMNESEELIKPKEPNAYKFEALVLDMIHMMDSCLPFEVVRNKEFAPIKNKTGVDSVESARALLKENGVDL